MTDQPQGISKITVKGFKSLYDETSIEIRPLTILAGANSSGKSSIMQPLLLMKQTLEQNYDPGTFKLDGPNVNYTQSRQFLSRIPVEDMPIPYFEKQFLTNIQLTTSETLKSVYRLIDNEIKTHLNSYIDEKGNTFTLHRDMNSSELEKLIPPDVDKLRETYQSFSDNKVVWQITPYRCFLNLNLETKDKEPVIIIGDPLPLKIYPLNKFTFQVLQIIHVPGLRGNPERSYRVSKVSEDNLFAGTFENYVASIVGHLMMGSDGNPLIQYWMEGWQSNEKMFNTLLEYLKTLNLATSIALSLHDEAQVGILISQTMNASQSQDMPHVNIADVGLGVSQVLPVLVALLVAKPGQLVYLEQPELHLHPRAQVALARILADAANRGVRVVVETHSSLLLIGIQTLIAEGKLKPADTILHWFTRDEDGKTTVDSQVPDENGAYGDWPEDFADVELKAQGAYLDAVARRQPSTEAGD